MPKFALLPMAAVLRVAATAELPRFDVGDDTRLPRDPFDGTE